MYDSGTMPLNRRQFLSVPALAALPKQATPLAITMWDFSWLERRWPGAGYENWDAALDELKTRGYDAVRIDAYPHFIHFGASRTWELLPQWSVQDWGAPARCRIRVQPELNQFIQKCGDRGLKVGLSSWFRQDIHDHRMRLDTPIQLGAAWKSTLDSIAADGLLRHIYYVDLCNEFPLDVWAPYVPKGLRRASAEGVRWMAEPIALLKQHYPDLAYTFSFTSEYQTWEQQDVSMLDFLELHLWMTHFSDFYQKVGYNYERFDTKGYDNLALNAEATYKKDPAHWQDRLKYGIDLLSAWSVKSGKPLITTECWGLVDYKDFPMLNWGWIMELCELGVRYASSKGRWAAMATSNFCGPQFRGMWRDIAWHRRLTDVIHSGRLPAH
jgi:hypothetical protein